MKKSRIALADGVFLTAVQDDRFKNEFLSVNFLTDLNGKENALAYLVSSVLVRGCEKYNSIQKLNAALEEGYDGEIGTDTYKTGNTRIIRFGSAWLRSDLTFDNTNPEDILLDVLSNVILHPIRESDGLLSESFTELEKISLLDCAQSEKNNKRSYALKSCIRLQLDGDEFAHPKYGSEEEIQEVDNKALTEFYERMIKTFPIEIYYHGFQDENTVKEKITDRFGSLINNKSPLSLENKSNLAPSEKVDSFSENGNCEQTVLVMGFSLPTEKEEKFPFIMLGEVLGLSPINRLFMNVRENLGICYYCDLTTFRSKNSAFISAGIKLKRKNEVFDAILHEIEDIANGNLTDEEINTAKTSVINAYVSLFDSPKDHESIVINSVLGGQYLSFEEYEENINNVTTQNIVDIAKKMKLRTVFTLLGG